MTKKFFFDFFHDFDLKIIFLSEKKKHFGQKSRKFVIFQTSWAHSYVGTHPMTIIFSFTCSPTSVLQPEQISWPYDFHRWLYEFLYEKKTISGKVQATLEIRLNAILQLFWKCRKLSDTRGASQVGGPKYQKSRFFKSYCTLTTIPLCQKIHLTKVVSPLKRFGRPTQTLEDNRIFSLKKWLFRAILS